MLRPDPARVLIRPYFPAVDPPDLHEPDMCRATRLAARVLALDDDEVAAELEGARREFGPRHRDLEAVFEHRFEQVRAVLRNPPEVTGARRLLIGAYFSSEYAFEAAALFNPSIVPHPSQEGVGPGELRFVLSLRATGEGHISSIAFRSGVIEAEGEVRLDPPGHYAIMPARAESLVLGHSFDVSFPPETPLAEQVIFPITPAQRNGLEDARFVRFVDDDGEAAYFATYTAYSGRDIAPELLRTYDFRRFTFLPLGGDAVRNKGMALFPRRIDGRYAMLARLDGENLQLALSDDLATWSHATPILAPAQPWEFLQIGNCGSPIELPEGWLVILHGVGPVRRYCIGAALLDLHDPSKVLARTRLPLLAADENERDGYVPNVVYSCGALVHQGNLILPFAVSDVATGFAVAPVRELLAAMS